MQTQSANLLIRGQKTTDNVENKKLYERLLQSEREKVELLKAGK